MSQQLTQGFVAINYIQCEEHYTERFEALFRTRAGAIDAMPGFRHMNVLKPQRPGEPYLVVSYWDSEQQFKAWTQSPSFLEGHRRAFEDIRQAKAQGQPAPMHSEFKTYTLLTA